MPELSPESSRAAFVAIFDRQTTPPKLWGVVGAGLPLDRYVTRAIQHRKEVTNVLGSVLLDRMSRKPVFETKKSLH